MGREREIFASEKQEEKKNIKVKELELEMIKKQYLGKQKERKRIAHPSERMRFVFDWDNKDDTSRDSNPIYDRPANVAILFGRGLIAGLDRSTQQKENMIHEKCARVIQKTIACKENDKFRLLENELQTFVNEQSILFTNSLTTAESVQGFLIEAGFKVSALYGNRNKKQNEQAIQEFHNQKTKILITTDTAIRGFDIKNISLVLNFDAANTTETYIHRICCIARAAKKCYAITLLTSSDSVINERFIKNTMK